MKYIIRLDCGYDIQYLTKDGEFNDCHHDSSFDVIWGEDLEELRIFPNKKEALKKLNYLKNKFEKELEDFDGQVLTLVPIREIRAIELLKIKSKGLV